MKTEAVIGIAVGAITLIAGAFGAMTYMDSRHTPVHKTATISEDLEELAGSFKSFTNEQEIRNLRQRLWQLQRQKLCSSRHSRVPNELDECKELRAEIEKLKEKK